MDISDAKLERTKLKNESILLTYEINHLKNDKSFIKLLISGIFLLIPLCFIPYYLDKRKHKLERLSQKLNFINNKIKALNAQLNI